MIGTWDGIDSESGMSSRDVNQLKDGDVVELTFASADLTTGEDTSFVGEALPLMGQLLRRKPHSSTAPTIYEYELIDIFGATYQSDMTTPFGGKHHTGAAPASANR